MKHIKEEKFIYEIKYDLIRLSDLIYDCSRQDFYKPIHVLMSLSALVQNKTAYNSSIPDFKFSGQAVAQINAFLSFNVSIQGNQFSASLGRRIGEIKPLSKKISTQLQPILSELEKESKHLSGEMKFTEHPPCTARFVSLYWAHRKKRFFNSTGFWSSFFYDGADQEMHLRIASSELLTFQKILDYGIKYPTTTSAEILRTKFPTYWDEAMIQFNSSQTLYFS